MREGDREEEPAPLADLLDDIEDGDGDDEVWDRLAEEFEADLESDTPSAGGGDAPDEDGSTDDALWQRLSAAESGAPVEEQRGGRIADRTPAWATISNNAKIVHGYLTVLSFGIALALYGAAVVGFLPRGVWLLSLPLFALGVVLLIPVLAWYLGAWDPTRIA